MAWPPITQRPIDNPKYKRDWRNIPTYAQKLDDARKLQQVQQQNIQNVPYSNMKLADIVPMWGDAYKTPLTYKTPVTAADYLEPKNEDDTDFWGGLGKSLGSEGPLGGLKGWLDLGVKGMNAYTGFQELKLARDQNRLAREAFDFQKGAWNKDYNARKIAYNTNAQMRNDWKRAQTPGGYTMDQLIV